MPVCPLCFERQADMDELMDHLGPPPKGEHDAFTAISEIDLQGEARP